MIASPDDVRAHHLLQETLLGEALENLDAAVFLADDDGRFVAVNRRACAITGYTREELLGVDVHGIAVDPSAFEEVLAGRKREGTVTLRRKDGSLVECSWRAGTTRIAGLTFYVGLNWPLDELPSGGAP